jgi:predicted component of type VI protein secretion system
MSDILATALADANKNPGRLTRIQVYHLTAAGLLGLNEEGEFIVTEKATRKVNRGKTEALIEEWAPKVQGAVKELIKDDTTIIRVDDVWKLLGSPDKATYRTPILKNLQDLRNAGVLTQHKRGESNFGIFYTSGPNWK